MTRVYRLPGCAAEDPVGSVLPVECFRWIRNDRRMCTSHNLQWLQAELESKGQQPITSPRCGPEVVCAGEVAGGDST